MPLSLSSLTAIFDHVQDTRALREAYPEDGTYKIVNIGWPLYKDWIYLVRRGEQSFLQRIYHDKNETYAAEIEIDSALPCNCLRKLAIIASGVNELDPQDTFNKNYLAAVQKAQKLGRPVNISTAPVIGLF